MAATSPRLTHSVHDLLRGGASMYPLGVGCGIPSQQLLLHEEEPPAGSSMGIGLVTECVSGVDREVLQSRRQQLRDIEEFTTAQIVEKAGIRSFNVMVTGPIAVVERALPLVEQALLGPQPRFSTEMELAGHVFADPGVSSSEPDPRLLLTNRGTGSTYDAGSGAACAPTLLPEHLADQAEVKVGRWRKRAVAPSAPNIRAGVDADFGAAKVDAESPASAAQPRAYQNLIAAAIAASEMPPPSPPPGLGFLPCATRAPCPLDLDADVADMMIPTPPTAEAGVAPNEQCPASEEVPATVTDAIGHALASVEVSDAGPVEAEVAPCALDAAREEVPDETKDVVVEGVSVVDGSCSGPATGADPVVEPIGDETIPVEIAPAGKSKKKSKAEKKRSQQDNDTDDDTILERHAAANDMEQSLSFTLPKPGPIEGVKSRKKAILRIENVGFAHAEQKQAVVADMNINLSQVTRMLVAGAKGAGKSTFVKLLVSEYIPTEGQILKVSGLRVGYVPQQALQNLGKHAKRTPIEYMQWRFVGSHDKEACDASLFAKLQDKTNQGSEAELEKHLCSFGVDHMSASQLRLGKMSSATKAKVILAAATWQRPHILVLDEPSSWMDRRVLNAFLVALNSYQGGVVIASHNKDKSVFDELTPEKWLLRGGRIRVDADSGDVADDAAAEVDPIVGAVYPLDSRPEAQKNRATSTMQAIQDVERKIKSRNLTDAERWTVLQELQVLHASLAA